MNSFTTRLAFQIATAERRDHQHHPPDVRAGELGDLGRE
jgi:hypothetical protein